MLNFYYIVNDHWMAIQHIQNDEQICLAWSGYNCATIISALFMASEYGLKIDTLIKQVWVEVQTQLYL